MFRLAHLSDVHLAPLPSVTWRQLASKRITGYLNWKRGRGKSMGRATLDALTRDLLDRSPDHVVVSGDLTNLALPAEIENAARWLATLGPPESVSTVPGNHDAYVPGAVEAATTAWAANMTGERRGSAHYPYMRRAGPVALIGCSTAEATPPFVAAGPFRAAQAERLERMLADAGRDGAFRVVVIHHPPVRGAAPPLKRMLGIGRFQDVIERKGAELVLHGHTHLPTQHAITGRAVPVIGVSAGGQDVRGHKPAARYNLFEIEGGPGAWRLEQIERGLGEDGTEIVEIARRNLAVPRS